MRALKLLPRNYRFQVWNDSTEDAPNVIVTGRKHRINQSDGVVTYEGSEVTLKSDGTVSAGAFVNGTAIDNSPGSQRFHGIWGLFKVGSGTFNAKDETNESGLHLIFQWSPNGTDWPSDGQGLVVASLSDPSTEVSFAVNPVALPEYYRLRFNNGTGASISAFKNKILRYKPNDAKLDLNYGSEVITHNSVSLGTGGDNWPSASLEDNTTNKFTSLDGWLEGNPTAAGLVEVLIQVSTDGTTNTSGSLGLPIAYLNAIASETISQDYQI